MPIFPKPIDVELFRSMFVYYPQTGDLVWRTGPRAGCVAGCRKHYAGTRIPKSIDVNIKYVFYPTHRIAWAIHTGTDAPAHLQIDHENRNPFDNRFANLRLATQAQNSANRIYRQRKLTLPKGAFTQDGGRTFRSQIIIDGHSYYLGSFKTAEEAHSAYMAAARAQYGEFARAAA